MLIDDQDYYHGAALSQVARHEAFTSINVMKFKGAPSRNAFGVNDDIGIYLKYSSKPTPRYKEYLFTFTKEHFGTLVALQKKRDRCFIVLACVKDGQICCVSLDQVLNLRKRRNEAIGRMEDTFCLLAVLPKGKQFRVYVNKPGSKGSMLGESLLVPRKSFPNLLFE